MSIEKHKFEIGDCFLIVEYRLAQKNLQYSLGVAVDVFPDGVSFEAPDVSFQQGDVLEINLKDPDSDFCVSAIGKVRWKKDGWYKCMMGINFQEIDEAARDRLLNLVSARKRKADDFTARDRSEEVFMQKNKPADAMDANLDHNPETKSHKEDSQVTDFNERERTADSENDKGEDSALKFDNTKGKLIDTEKKGKVEGKDTGQAQKELLKEKEPKQVSIKKDAMRPGKDVAPKDKEGQTVKSNQDNQAKPEEAIRDEKPHQRLSKDDIKPPGKSKLPERRSLNTYPSMRKKHKKRRSRISISLALAAVIIIAVASLIMLDVTNINLKYLISTVASFTHQDEKDNSAVSAYDDALADTPTFQAPVEPSETRPGDANSEGESALPDVKNNIYIRYIRQLLTSDKVSMDKKSGKLSSADEQTQNDFAGQDNVETGKISDSGQIKAEDKPQINEIEEAKIKQEASEKILSKRGTDADHKATKSAVIWDDGQPDVPKKKEDKLVPASLKEVVNFDKNSSSVEPEFLSAIERIADTLLTISETKVKVVGHTDSVGPKSYNMDLSIQRANEVRKLLLQRGIDDLRIEIIGLGDASPVASNDTMTGRRRNRRVELIIVPLD